MFTATEATKELVAAYTAALNRERAGYEARVAALAAGGTDRLTEDALTNRIAEVDAEAKRVSTVRARAGKAKK